MKTRWKIAQAAEIRWWQGYLKKKPKAEYVAWKKAYWNQLLEELGIRPQAGQRLLDAGCGPAGMFMVLDGESMEVDALDPLLEQYEEKLPHFDKGDYPGVRFISQPLEKFDAEPPYDVVFCLNAINHVSDLAACFDILERAVRPGGTLVCSIDAHNHAFFKHLFRLIPGDILHPHQYDLAEYQKMLTDRGFQITQSLRKDQQFFFDYYVLVAEK